MEQTGVWGYFFCFVWFERFALWELLGSDNARFDGGDGSRRGLVVIGLVVVLGR